MPEKIKIQTSLPKQEYQPNHLCITCEGRCCKRSPGALLPSDINPLSLDRVAEMLETGLYVIDWCETEPLSEKKGYFLRPTVIGRGEEVYDPDWRGQCIFLTPTGCRLGFNARPWNCRAVKPSANPDGTITCHIPSINPMLATAEQIVAEAWEPYWDLLHAAAKIVEEGREINGLRICHRCGADISHHRPNRMFCSYCVRIKKVQTTDSAEWIAAQAEWRVDHMDYLDIIEGIEVLINVVPKNWGLGQINLEEM